MRMLGKITAFAGFTLIVGSALLAINGNLDNTTFTAVFVVGFILVVLSRTGRTQRRTVSEQIR